MPTETEGRRSWLAPERGNCHPELRDYLRELDRYRGRERVWFVNAFEPPRAVLVKRGPGLVPSR